MPPRKVLKLIGFKDFEPDVMFTTNCHQWFMKNCTHPGSDVEYLKMILESAGLDYELIQQEITVSDAIIDAINNGTADMSLIALIVTPERLKKVAFTSPINYLQFGYYVKELNVLESDQFLIKTFTPDVYMVLCCVVALVAGFTFIAYRHYTFKHYLWLTFAAFFNQTNYQKSKKSSYRFLTGAYWFTAFLTICFYQARMKYFLTVPLQKGIDFYNIEQLLDQLETGKWKAYQADNGYSLLQYCQKTQCNRIQDLMKKGKIINLNNVSLLVDVPIQNHYSVTFDAISLDIVPNEISVFDRKNKVLFVRDTTVSVDMVAFAVNKNFTIEIELLNRAIAKFQDSYANVRGRYTPPYSQYQIDTVQNGAVTLTLLHFNILFFAYIAMVILALIIFGVEFFHFRYNWKNNDRTWKPQTKSYDMNGNISLSTDSTLKSGDVNFTRKTIKFFIDEKIVDLKIANGLDKKEI